MADLAFSTPARALVFGLCIHDYYMIVARSSATAPWARSGSKLSGTGAARTVGRILARCLIPRFDGAILSLEWKEAVCDRYVTGAPRPRTPSEQQQRSQASLSTLSRELGINPKTVAKWRKRATVEDLKTGPKAPHSTTLSQAEEAAVVAFRRHTLLPLDDCLYALQPSIPHLTRSALHHCLQRHGISRLPDIEGDKSKRQRFKRYPIGFFHMDIAEVQTAEGKLYLFVGIDRTSKFAVTQLVDKADRRTA
jgi:hypothetical protein